MKTGHLTALSTAVISFATVLGLMVGFYFNLKAVPLSTSIIFFGEIILLGVVGLFTTWVKGGIEKYEA